MTSNTDTTPAADTAATFDAFDWSHETSEETGACEMAEEMADEGERIAALIEDMDAKNAAWAASGCPF